MADLKLIKGGKSEENSKTPDYISVIALGILIVGFTVILWIMKFCFDIALDYSDSVIEGGNRIFIGFSISMLSLIGIVLGKEMTDSPKKSTSRFGIAIFCYFIGLFVYGAGYFIFK